MCLCVQHGRTMQNNVEHDTAPQFGSFPVKQKQTKWPKRREEKHRNAQSLQKRLMLCGASNLVGELPEHFGSRGLGMGTKSVLVSPSSHESKDSSQSGTSSARLSFCGRFPAQAPTQAASYRSNWRTRLRRSVTLECNLTGYRSRQTNF